MITTIVALALFGALGLLLMETLWRRLRHRRNPMLAAGLICLALLATAAWLLFPALWDTSAERLRAELADRDTRVTALTSAKTQLARDADRLAGELTTERARLASQVEREARDLAHLAAEAAHVRDVLTSGPQALLIDPPIVDGATPQTALRSEILRFATLRAPPALLAGPTPEPRLVQPMPPGPLEALKSLLATRLSTPNYDIEAYPDRELIRGRAGRYYIVDLKNAASGVRFFFEGGKYTLPRSAPEFRSAMNNFIADVLQKFEGRVDYALFVRGSADQKPYAGTLEAGSEFSRITFVRSLGGDRYGIDMGERRIDGRVHNADLPELRAAFIQKIISDIYPTTPPVVLEGSVTPKTDTRDRNVELILYVNW